MMGPTPLPTQAVAPVDQVARDAAAAAAAARTRADDAYALAVQPDVDQTARDAVSIAKTRADDAYDLALQPDVDQTARDAVNGLAGRVDVVEPFASVGPTIFLGTLPGSNPGPGTLSFRLKVGSGNVRDVSVDLSAANNVETTLALIQGALNQVYPDVPLKAVRVRNDAFQQIVGVRAESMSRVLVSSLLVWTGSASALQIASDSSGFPFGAEDAELHGRSTWIRQQVGDVYVVPAATTFNLAVFLDTVFAGDRKSIDPYACEYDIQLVGGGAAGSSKYAAASASTGYLAGSWGGRVRNVRGARLGDFESTTVQIGAGGVAKAAGITGSGAAGGDTKLGPWTAQGGPIIQSAQTSYEKPNFGSDVDDGQPGFADPAKSPAPKNAIGPGPSGCAYTDASTSIVTGGAGGIGNVNTMCWGGIAGFPNGTSAQVLQKYGMGGGGASASNAGTGNGGNGGFPGGAGGPLSAVAGSTRVAGNGGNGVIRITTFRYVRAGQ